MLFDARAPLGRSPAPSRTRAYAPGFIRRVCVCARARVPNGNRALGRVVRATCICSLVHTHTHTHMHAYTYGKLAQHTAHQRIITTGTSTIGVSLRCTVLPNALHTSCVLAVLQRSPTFAPMRACVFFSRYVPVLVHIAWLCAVSLIRLSCVRWAADGMPCKSQRVLCTCYLCALIRNRTG